MPRVVVDLSEAKRAPFELLPAGRYLCVLRQSEKATSQAGNEMMVWDWEILEPAEYAGRTIRTWTSLLKHASFGFRDHLLALGEPEPEGGWDTWDDNTDKFTGRRAMLSVIVDTRKGRDGNDRDFNSVVRLEPAPKGASAPRRVRTEASDVPY